VSVSAFTYETWAFHPPPTSRHFAKERPSNQGRNFVLAPQPNQAAGQLSQPLQLLQEDNVGLILRTASGALVGEEMSARGQVIHRAGKSLASWSNKDNFHAFSSAWLANRRLLKSGRRTVFPAGATIGLAAHSRYLAL